MIGKKTSAKFISPDYIFEAILQKHIHTKVNVSKSDLVVDKETEVEDNDQPQEIEPELEVTEDNLAQKKDEEIELKVPEEDDEKVNEMANESINLVREKYDVRKVNQHIIEIINN